MARFSANSLSFTPGGGTVIVPNNAIFKNLTALTVECYIDTLAAPTNYGRVMEYNSGNFGFDIYSNGTTRAIGCNVGNSSAVNSPNSNQLVPIGQKIHIAITWDGIHVNFFIAGAKDSAQGNLSGGNTGDPGISLSIGGGGFTSIAELRISNNARYSTSFTPPVGVLPVDANTVELWHLNEGTGSTTTGVKGTIGTLSGSPLPTWTTRTIVS